MADWVQVTTTLPDHEAAQQVAQRLVEERLAACAQVTGPVSSTYRWRGEVEHAAEWYCHLKTIASRLPELQTRLRELHPYEVPEIIALPILSGDAEYLKWIEDSVDPAGTLPRTREADASGETEPGTHRNHEPGR